MLSQQEADEFMGATKRTPSPERPFQWDEAKLWARSRYPVEVRAAQVGEVFFVASLEVPQHWTFKLEVRGEEVYRLDVRPIGRHRNPPNCPVGFPRTVPESAHEHVYVEGLDMKCARPLANRDIANHAQCFTAFCTMAKLTFEPEYRPPPLVRPRLDLA